MSIMWQICHSCHSFLSNDVSRWPLKSIHCNDCSTMLSPHKQEACILQCVMLVINQPVSQIDTNQPRTPSHSAWLPISEMAGTTHREPSALHFISKCLYHLSAYLMHTWGTLWGARASVGLWFFCGFGCKRIFCVAYCILKSRFSSNKSKLHW